MKASELLLQLHELIAVHGGDLPVSLSLEDRTYSVEAIEVIEQASVPVRIEILIHDVR
jgi:hypothetical protein